MSQETNESNNGEPVDDDPELPPNWIPLIDDNDNVYFYNVKSRVSRWNVPKKVPEPLQVRACHILIKHRDVKNPVSKGAHPGPVTKTFEEALHEAEEIRARIGGDIKKFQEIAKEESDDNSYVRGGDLGRFTRNKMHKEFSDAAFELDINEISGVISSPSGLHIILQE